MTLPLRAPWRALRAALAAAVVVSSASVLAGCGQEGRTVQNPLVVQGVAYDITRLSGDTVPPVDTAAVVDIEFKIQVRYFNLCEATRAGVEIRRTGSTSAGPFILTPVARYEADDECNVGAAGDTVVTLKVLDVPIETAASAVSFAVQGAIPAEIAVPADTGLATTSSGSIRYQIRVEDGSTGQVLAGAQVRLERADTAALIAEGTTDANGLINFIDGCTAGSLETATPYTVQASFAGRTTILRMRFFPARCGARERIVVRV